jgi:hypothetical protein
MANSTGPAAATGRVRVLFTTTIGEIEREAAFVIRGSTWPIFDIAKVLSMRMR